MMRIYHQAFATAAKGLAFLHRCTHFSQEEHPIFRRGAKAVERNTSRTLRALSIALVVSLLVTSTPSAPQTIIDIAAGWRVSAVFRLHENSWPTKLRLLLTGQNPAQPTATGTMTATVTPASSQLALADPGGPSSAVSGMPVQFSGAGSFDPDSTITAYRRDFAGTKIGTGANPIDASSRHIGTLPVTDNRGATRSGSMNVNVERFGNKAELNAEPEIVGWDPTNRGSLDDPANDRGDSPNRSEGNNNFQIVAPVLSLPGRGLDLTLNLVYNSLVWNKSGNEMAFDIDQDWPAPGWHLGFGKMVAMDTAGAMIIEPDGTRHSFTGTVFTDQYTQLGYPVSVPTFKGQTTDGSFIQYRCERVDGSGQPHGVARYPDGTVVSYSNFSTDFSTPHNYLYPYGITDSNGNHISIKYLWDLREPRIERIIDSVGRVITFHYDSQKLLTAITGPGLPDASGTPTTRTFVRLHYATQPLTLSGAFSNLTTRVRNSSPSVIDAIYYPATGTGYWFGPGSYSSYGMLRKVVQQRGMGFSANSLAEQGTVTEGTMTRQQVYDYPSSPSALSSAPTFGNVTETWDGGTADAVTTFVVQNNSSLNERTVTITNPDGTKTVERSFNFSNPPPNDPNKFKDGLVKEKQMLDADGNLLGKTTFTWEAGSNNAPRLTRTETTDERGQVLATDYDLYGDNNAVGRVRERDYAGSVLWTTRNTFVSYLDNDLDQRITPGVPSAINAIHPRRINLVDSVKVYTGDDSANMLASHRVFKYDEYVQPLKAYTPDYQNGYDLFAFGEPRQPNGITGILQHSGSFNPMPYNSQNGGGAGENYITKRGNLTSVISYADTTNPSSPANPTTETRTYDMAGNVIATSKACCEQMSSVFELAMQYAFPTSQTRGSADSGSLMRITTSATYDLKTGLQLSSTDANGRQTTTSYSIESWRPEAIVSPTGARTNYEYDDAALKLTQTSRLSLNGAIASQTITYLNGLGQVQQEKALGANNVWDIVDTEYDFMGRVSQQTRPYRVGDQRQWTITTYDALSRVTRVTGSDGSITETYYNEKDFDPSDSYIPTRPNVASNVPGQTTLVRDAWGRERWGRTDSQGRLVELVEPNPSGPGTVATGGLVTTYSYNTLGNLVGITQGAQTRAFKYDSLGRLTAQKLAEASATLNDAGQYVGAGTWSDVFTYDNRSNLTSRTDARGVKTVFSFNNDPLNRLQSVSWDTNGFSDTANPIVAAATITYQYRTKDNPTQLLDVTQLSSITTSGVSAESYVYDSEGRISAKSIVINGRPSMDTDYAYDTLNRVKDITYPKRELGVTLSPRKVVHHNYDVASRMTSLTVDAVAHASQIVYNASGQTTSLKVGLSGANQITENYAYNSQTGLLDNQTVVRGGATTLLNLSYDYAGANGKRTGQLTKILNNLNHNKDRSYAYDALGRLTQATGGPASAPLWTQTYSYDRFGNRTSVSANGYSAKAGSAEPGSAGILPAMSAQREPADPEPRVVATGSLADPKVALPTDQLSAKTNGDSQRASRSAFNSHHASRTNTAISQSSPPVFTDPDLLASGGVIIKALHITELRTAINDLRVQRGFSVYSWQTSAASGGLIRADPILEMRTSLDQILGPPSAPGYSPGLAQFQPILAIHIQELRNRVVAAWNTPVQIPFDGHANLSYNTATNRITSAGFAYDAAGNQTRALASSGGSQRFQYDAANRLVKVKADDNQTLLASYTYGDSNERLIAEEGGLRTYYACDGKVEYTESGGSTIPQWSKTYIYLGARLLSTLTPNGSGSEAIQYHHPDRLGTRLVTNAQDATYFEQVSLPYGTALGNESTGATNLRFTSYDRSATTGLDYAVNRRYDSRQGRFTQVDPIGMRAASLADPQSLNMYSYVGNDPVNRVDPDGQFWGTLFRFLGGLFRSFKPNIINGSFAYGNRPPISVSFTTNFQNIGVGYAGIGIPLRSGGLWLPELLNPQQTESKQQRRCTFNINIKGLKGDRLTSVQNVIRDIFNAADQDVVFNNAGAANATTGSYSLEFGKGFSKNVASYLNKDERNTYVGFSPFDASGRFLGFGGVATRNIERVLGKGTATTLVLGRLGAHESGHFFLQLLGHPSSQGLMRVFDETISDPTKDADFRFTAEQAQKLSTLCSP